jgi:hypothetical protein
MATDYIGDRPHVLVFRTTAGELVLGTRSLSDVGQQEWFREFLNIQPQRVMVQTQPVVQQRAPEVDMSYLEDLKRQMAQMQAAQAAQVRPMPVPQPPKRSLPSSFLEITMEQMDDQIWKSLTPEQQYQWQQKYVAAR